MIKGQKSVRGGIQDFLCPFTDMYITQGSNMKPSHMGIMANDVRGLQSGVRYPYYAPCDVKCVKIYPASGQAMWQSLNKVRFANGRIDYATFMTVHDNTFDAHVGQIVRQGDQLGNMGTKGNATGVHCHIEISQSSDTSWYKNRYGVYQFNNEYDTDSCYFVDNTNIIYGMGGNWKYLSQVPVASQSEGEKVDQILHVGSKVKFDGVFKADILRSPLSTNMFGNTKLTGVSYNTYYANKCKEHHWIPLNDWTEVSVSGNPAGQDNVITGGVSYIKNDKTYTVQEIDIPSNSARLTLNGHNVWIFSTFLREV